MTSSFENQSEERRLKSELENKRKKFQRAQNKLAKTLGICETRSGRALFNSKLPNIVKRCTVDLDLILKAPFRTAQAKQVQDWLNKRDDEELKNFIVITVISLIESTIKFGGIDFTAGRASRIIGEAIVKEAFVLDIKKKHPKAYQMHLTTQLGERRFTWQFFRAHFERNYGVKVADYELNYELRNRIGQVFFELVLRNTDLVNAELIKEIKTPGRVFNKLIVRPSARLEQELQELDSHFLNTLQTDYIPIFIPPIPWSKPDVGGYPDNSFLLVKGAKHEKECPKKSDAPLLYRALNIHQQVPWRVNDRMRHLITTLWESRALVVGMPSRDPEPVPPPLANETWKAMAPKDRRDYGLNRRLALRKFRIETDKRIQMYGTVRAINKHAGKKIWFPGSVDFRGRMYSSFPFGPQSSDIVRSSIEFDKGEKLKDEEAFNWLKIHGANLYGQKGTFKERVSWVDSVQKEINELVSSGPTGAMRSWWEAAKNPWQFLNWVEQIKDAENDLPVHMPVALDGTCNGIQIWSLLLRDAELGESVNVIPNASNRPNDFYENFAKHLTRIAKEDKTEHFDLLLEVGITRSFVKPIIMSIPYGITSISVRQLIQKEIDAFKSRPGKDHFRAAFYTAPIIMEEARKFLKSVFSGLDWIKRYAKLAVKNGQYPAWINPIGLKVQQRYENMRKECVRLGSLGCKFRIVHSYFSGGPHKTLNLRGISANFVHSIDSALMMKTLLKCHDEKGISDFNMIHDSYGVHPNYVSDLSLAVRESAFEIFEKNPLETLIEEAASRYGEGMPAPPVIGTLNVKDVLNSEYFFS